MTGDTAIATGGMLNQGMIIGVAGADIRTDQAHVANRRTGTETDGKSAHEKYTAPKRCCFYLYGLLYCAHGTYYIQ
jgi:hypothetical protein